MRGSSRWAVGIVLLVIICVIWSISSVVVQRVEGAGVDAFVLTYLCNALFALYLVPAKFCPESNDGGWKELQAALWLSPLWMLANASYNASLETTSITSSTILATTSSLWTLGLAAVVGVEGFTWSKAFAGMACVGGAALVAWGDTSDETLVGDGLALASAVFYAAYGTGLQAVQPVEPYRLFGLLGVCNAVLFAAPLAGLGLARPAIYHRIEPSLFGLVILKGLFDNALSDFLWAKAVVLTSPTVATVGLSLTIPLAFLIDAYQGHLDERRNSLALRALGALVILAGFLLVANHPDSSKRRHDPHPEDDVACAAADHRDDDDHHRSRPRDDDDDDDDDVPSAFSHDPASYAPLRVKQSSDPDDDDDDDDARPRRP